MYRKIILLILLYSPSLVWAGENNSIKDSRQEFFKAPPRSLYLTEQEKTAWINTYYYNMEYHGINYSMDITKKKLIQAIFDSIDRNKTIYDALNIKYHIKYNRQCPIDFVNNGSLDTHICYETYNEYLKYAHQYQKDHSLRPTFWHDTPYYVPDESYLTIAESIVFIYMDDNIQKITIRRPMNYDFLCLSIKDIAKIAHNNRVSYTMHNKCIATISIKKQL